jgi:hypothetical protein
MDEIYGQLKQLEEHHVQAVRKLERLAKALDHVLAAKGELDGLAADEGHNPILAHLPDQLKTIEDALAEETWRVRAYIMDVELDQNHLRRLLQQQGGDHTAR